MKINKSHMVDPESGDYFILPYANAGDAVDWVYVSVGGERRKLYAWQVREIFLIALKMYDLRTMMREEAT